MLKNKTNSIKRLRALSFCSQTWGRRFTSLLAGTCLLMGSVVAIADIGEQQWQNILNEDDAPWDLTTFESVEFRNDGSVLASGSGGGGFAVRYNAQSGDLLDTPDPWINFDTVAGGNYFYDQVTDGNGDIYFSGRYTGFDPGTWKYNASAELQTGWPKVSTGAGDGLYTGVAVDSLGFVYSAGYNNAGWLISKHATSDGTVPAGFPITFNLGFGGKAGQVAVDSEDNFIVSGWLGVAGPSYDWHVRKYASNGTLIWQASYDLKGNIEAAIDVAVDSEDNVIVIGYRNDGSDDGAGIARDWYMVKYAKDPDMMGDAVVLWEQSWNSGKASASYVARTLVVDSTDNIYVGGEQPDVSNTLGRPLVQYRDGQTGALIRSQNVDHPLTVRGEAGIAGPENSYIKGLAIKDDQLVVVGYVWESYILNGRTAFISMFKLLPGVGNVDWSSTVIPEDYPYNSRFYGVDFLSNDVLLAGGEYTGSAGIGIRYAADTGIPEDVPAEWIEVAGTRFNQQYINSAGDIYFANFDGRVHKYASNGSPAMGWPITTGMTTYDVTEDSTGDVYVVGGSPDWKIHKFSSSGVPVGGAFPISYDHAGLNDYVYRIAVDSEDNFIVVGPVMQDASPDHWDWLVRKYSSDGTTVLWEKIVDGGGNEDHPGHILIDSMDNVLVSGRVNDGKTHNGYIVKYAKSDGGILWSETVVSNRNTISDRMVLDSEGNIYVAARMADINNLWRYQIHYRDGTNGDLLKIQDISNPTTQLDDPNHESNDGAPYIAMSNGQLVISGYVSNRTNPLTYKETAFTTALTRSFTITPTSGVNGSIMPATKVEDVAYQDTVNITANAQSNYHVATINGCGINYSNTDNGINSYSTPTGAATVDCEVSATFAINTFEVTPSKTGDGTISPSTVQTIDYDGTVDFTLDPDDHWHYVDITGTCPEGAAPIVNGDGSLSYTTGSIDSDCTVIANFEIDTNLVSPSANGNGTISPDSPQAIGYNNTAQFTLMPDDHHHIVDIGGTCLPGDPPISNGPGTWGYTSGAITADCTVIANFAIDTFDVTPSITGSGTISPDTDQNVDHNGTVQFILDPDDHFYIKNISGTCPSGSLSDNGNGTWTHTTGAITADCTVSANFAIDMLEVTPSTDGNGTTDPASVSEVAYNTSIEFTLTPNAFYHPDAISGSCPAGSLVDNEDGTWSYTTGPIVVNCGVDFSFNNTFDVSPSSRGLGTIDPSVVVSGVIYGNTVDFTLTPTSDEPPEPVTGTCPAGMLIDNMDGTWAYTTGAIVDDCTVIANFEDDITFFIIALPGGKAAVIGL